MKQCSDCRRFLARSDFCNNRSRTDGLAHACRYCVAKGKKERWARTKPRPASQRRQREYARVWKYGLTPCAFTRLRIECADLCELCGIDPAEHIDHSHKTGEVRGLLCGMCNRGLGQFKDDVERLRSAVLYLTK